MKRIIALIMAVCMIFVLAGCGESKQQPQTDPGQDQQQAGDQNEVLTAPLTIESYPKIDGSTVTIPLSEALFSRLTGTPADEAPLYICHNTTDNAYMNLVYGDTDLIFVTGPSEDEQYEMQVSGVDYEVIPVVSEAFVFLTNKNNPVKDLTHQQILDIYSGKITNWKEVGGENLEITAFQRPVNSGSQTGMIDLVMGDTRLTDAPVTLRPAFMGDLIEAVSAYDEGSDAIGYSYYYYVNDMWGYDETKMLSIDGVAPSPQTISDGSYRYHTAYYAIFRADEPEDSPVRLVVDWLLSEEGQQLAEDTGYCKVK